MKRTLAASLVLCTTLTLGLNTSPAFAETVNNIPVINHLTKVLTFREYEKTTPAVNETVKIPEVQLEDKDYEKLINTSIQEKMAQVIKEAEENAAEYKEAYLETGGTEENYTPVELVVNYDIKNQEGSYLSFTIDKGLSLAPAYNATYFYNIDLETSKKLTLAKLLGDDYQEALDTFINKEIQRRTAEGESFFEGDMGFVGVEPEQTFYINNKNEVVLVFEKYAIAPGYMGAVEFAYPLPTDK